MIEAVAAGLGHLARLLLILMRVAVGASGPALIVYGAFLIYRPAAFVVAGLLIMMLLQNDKKADPPSEERE